MRTERQIPRANALWIWLAVLHAPSCIVTTNPSRTSLNPLTRTQRSKFIQLKFGILPLKYETDRYQGIAPERRLCELCTLNVPEDEIHFLFQCPALSTTRVTFFQRFSDNHLEFGDDHFENMSNLLNRNILFQWVCSPNLFTRNAKVLCICDDHWNMWKNNIVHIVLYRYPLFQYYFDISS